MTVLVDLELATKVQISLPKYSCNHRPYSKIKNFQSMQDTLEVNRLFFGFSFLSIRQHTSTITTLMIVHFIDKRSGITSESYHIFVSYKLSIGVVYCE